MIAVGLVMLSLLLVVAMRRTGTSPHPVAEGKPASAESQRIFRPHTPATSPLTRSRQHSQSNPFTPFFSWQSRPKPTLTAEVKHLNARSNPCPMQICPPCLIHSRATSVPTRLSCANSSSTAGRKPTRQPQPRGPRNWLKAPPAAPRSNKLPSPGPTPTCLPPQDGCARYLKARANKQRPSASLTKPPGPSQ